MSCSWLGVKGGVQKHPANHFADHINYGKVKGIATFLSWRVRFSVARV